MMSAIPHSIIKNEHACLRLMVSIAARQQQQQQWQWRVCLRDTLCATYFYPITLPLSGKQDHARCFFCFRRAKQKKRASQAANTLSFSHKKESPSLFFFL